MSHLDPDPLSVSWVEGYQAGIETKSRRPVLMALIGAALSGAIVGALLTAAIVHASPRADHLPTVPVTDAGQLGAPQNVRADGSGEHKAGAAELPAMHGEASPATESGAPTSSSSATSGVASWYRASGLIAAAGPGLRTGDWRGRLVTVTAGGRSVTVVLSDWCACPKRLIDLSDDAFVRLAPLSVGLVRVTVERGGPSVTPPPTDVTP